MRNFNKECLLFKVVELTVFGLIAFLIGVIMR